VAKKTISQLKKLADKYFSLAVRYRDCELINGDWVGKCITCDRKLLLKQAHAGHFQSRRFNSTRYDEENVNLQCPGCNLYGAGEQYKYSIEIDLKYGTGTAKKLAKRAREYYKLTTGELEEIISDAKKEIAWYEKMVETQLPQIED